MHSFAWLIGRSIEVALLLFFAIPLLIGLLIAFQWIRYRVWLALPAFGMSLATLAASGNYLYNLTYLTSNRFPLWMNIALCGLTFGTPPFLFILILAHSRRRVLWAAAMLLFTGLALLSTRSEYVERVARDAEAYRQGARPLSPTTGTLLVRWWRDYHTSTPRVLLQGHVLEATPVTLLTDPFSGTFQPQFCTAVASTYTPPVKDPALLGNVTEVANLQGCAKDWVQGLAVLERPVSSFQAVELAPFSGAPDLDVFTRPVVRQAFGKLAYDVGNFDASKAQVTQASGQPQMSVYVTALRPTRIPPSHFPCAGPVLFLSMRELANVQAVFPYCAVVWNLFRVDHDLYFAAVTEQPTPPDEELAMNPDTTYWLFRIDGGELKQLWPAT